MDPKEYIIKLLDKLWKYRLPAKGIIVLLNHNKLSKEQIKWLILIIEQAIKSSSDQKQQQVLKESLAIIKKIQSLEQIDRQKDQEDLNELDKMLDNI